MPIALAALVTGLVSLAAWRLGALTRSGAIAGWGVGVLILGNTGWPGLAVLGVYFGSSTVVGRLGGSGRSGNGDRDRETRNHWQVLANGGAAALVAPLEQPVPGLGFWLVTVTLAAAAADTWATGLGALSPRPPRDILRGVRAAPGTSGGVTWFGSSGGLVGAALVALAAVASRPAAGARLYLTAAAVGFLGMALDSVLGSAVQARFHCFACDRETEDRVHGCGALSEYRRGWRWLNNDGVNAVTTGAAAVLGALAWCWWGRS